MNCRKNVKSLNSDEKQALVQAFLDLKDPVKAPSLIPAAQARGANSRYDDYIWLHTIVNLGAHRRPGFLAWHRKFLDLFEADLQSVSGNPKLALPYWDWSDLVGSNPFTTDFLGGSGDANEIVQDGPFAHSAGNWNLNVPPENSVSVDPELRRGTVFGSDPIQSLPTPQEVLDLLNVTPLDASPWNDGSATQGFRNRLEGWFGGLPVEFHNAGHVYIGGSMSPDSSPQDPIFWMHHANVDRLWATWQQKHPTEPYVPGSGENATLLGHRLGDNMSLFGTHFGTEYTIDSVLDHKAGGYMYETDIPSVVLDTPSIDFGNVPEGMTTYHAVRFRVETCRQVSFEIVNNPTGNFSLTPITTFTANPEPGEPFVYGYVFIAFTANSPGSQESSNVGIRAYFTDVEGFYTANPMDEYELLNETIDIFATPVSMQQTAVALVVDRSGSMSGTATTNSSGTPISKFNVMQDAIAVFSDLMRPEDGVGLVSYDDVTNRLADITKMGPYAPITAGSGRDQINTILSGPDLDPRGLTGIGAAILEGNNVLSDGQAAASTPYDTLALVVMTDGNENQSPTIADVEPSISAHTFAVGLGTAGNVSEASLELIAQNNDGELLVTGDMSSQIQQFFLTKLFVQVLAGITNQDIILDPHGNLTIGGVHKIPFMVSEADVDLDVILLSDFADLIDFCIELPNGKILDVNDVQNFSNIEFIGREKTAFYRMRLPALVKEVQNSHGGQWNAILKFDEKKIRELIKNENKRVYEFLKSESKSIAYDLIVQTRSNLNMKVRAVQNSFEPGAEIKLVTELKQYNQPFNYNANVRAEIKNSNGTIKSITLDYTKDGQYECKFIANTHGIHSIRVLAEGRTFSGDSFTREKVISVSIFKGGYKRPELPENNPNTSNEGLLCGLISCIIEQDGLNDLFYKRLKEWGIDPEIVLKCIEKHKKEAQKIDFKATLSADRLQRLKSPNTEESIDETFAVIKNLLIKSEFESKGLSKSESKDKNALKKSKVKKPELGQIDSDSFYTGKASSSMKQKRK